MNVGKTNRGLKTRTSISNAVDKNIYNDFKELSNKTKIPMSKLLDEALEDIMIKYKKLIPNLFDK